MEESEDCYVNVDVYFDIEVYFDFDVAIDQKNGEDKGGKYLEKGNIWSTEEKKNGVGKG